MEYTSLGNSGLKISKIILGCMSFGSKSWGNKQDWIMEGDEAIEQIKYAYDLGINTFDTADVYSNGKSEIVLGQALRKHNIPREKVVIMTKCFFAVDTVNNQFTVNMTPDELDQAGLVNQYGLSRKNIFGAVKASLQRLGMDYVDVLQCHRFDQFTPIEETMQALHDVVQAGYVRYIGMSSCHAYQFHIMQNYAITNKLTPFILMQNHYSLLYREEEREMFPTLNHFGVRSIPWAPIARGLLARPYNTRTNRGDTDWYIGGYNNRGAEEIIKRVEKVANDKGVKMAQVAIAWTLHKNGVAAPILGTSSKQNLTESIDAIKVKLTEEELKYMEEPYELQNVYGHV